MPGKSIASVGLLIFVGASVGTLLLKSARTPMTSPKTAVQEQAVAMPAAPPVGLRSDEVRRASGKVLAYYLHGTKRCKTCLTIEAYTDEALQGRFAEQLRSGTLKWQSINVDEPQNEHFVQDFQLVTSSLVLVAVADGVPLHWKLLEDTWELVRDKPAFQSYVAAEAGSFLEGVQ